MAAPGAAREPEVVEGESPLNSVVLIEFPDLEAARAWYDSPDYQPLKELRQRSSRNTAVFFTGPADQS